MDRRLDINNQLCAYIISVLYILNLDYEEYYNDLFKNALKYGLSRKEFWYEILWQEYFLYEEAYYEKLHETTHMQGYYNLIFVKGQPDFVEKMTICAKEKGRSRGERPWFR